MVINEVSGSCFFCGGLGVDFTVERVWCSRFQGDGVVFVPGWGESIGRFFVKYLGMLLVVVGDRGVN